MNNIYYATPTLKRLKLSSPVEAYKKVRKYFPLVYINRDVNMTYCGYDISSLGENLHIVEFILLNELPIQMRFLNSSPYWSDSARFH